jgi:hypothetical protein
MDSSGSKLAGTFRAFFRKSMELSVKPAAGTFRSMTEQSVRQSTLPHKMPLNAHQCCGSHRVSERPGRVRVQLCWNSDTNNKLFEIQPVIKSIVVNRLPRRYEILIQRLRIGHTYLTRYLLHRETAPECEFCHVRLTVEHLLLSCW